MEQLINNEGAILLLQGFASLIQLWAGICLLFFYESLLEVSPFTTICKEIRSLYHDFINRYNGLIPEGVISVDEYVKDHWSSNIAPTIKCVASVCFFYSVFILAFIGIEKCQNYGANYYHALQFTNTLVIVYLVNAIIFYKRKVFHGIKPSIVLIIIILLYFHFHFYIFTESFSFLNKSQITIYTVFTCISGILLVCLRLFISWCVLKFQIISLSNINKKFRDFVDFNLGNIQLNELSKRKRGKLMKQCNKKFEKGEIDNIDYNTILTEMKNEIAKEYKEFTNNWWIKVL